MVNINYSPNSKILKKCKPLYDYAYFVNTVRSIMSGKEEEYYKNKPKLAEAIGTAINQLPEDSVIKPLLLSSRAEVIEVCVLEYNQEYHDNIRRINEERMQKQLEQAEAKAEQAEAEKVQAIKEKLNLISGMRQLGVSEEDIQKILNGESISR